MADNRTSHTIIQKLVAEFSLPFSSIATTVQLLDEGCTIPFIARYRKEATGNLDEVQVKNIEERLNYLLELEERKESIITSLVAQEKLTEELKAQILAAETKSLLEDLYLPYKPKRRTRAMIAKERGLEPLAELIKKQPLFPLPEEAAKPFVSLEKGVENEEEAIAQARDIVAEAVAENAAVRAWVRECYQQEGILISKVRNEKIAEPTKFEQYYDFKEPIRSIAYHRYLAIRRGEREEVLDVSLFIDPEPALAAIEKIMGLNVHSPYAKELKAAIADAFHRLICPTIETEIKLDLKIESDKASIAVFAENVRHLLLASPLGEQTVIGIDPGIRTGCKCAVVDARGKYLESKTIYLSQGQEALLEAKKTLLSLVALYRPFAIAIGNGTAGRETESWVKTTLKETQEHAPIVIPVNESGASVYSASEIAREEFPDLDLTIRGAISIARRLQDPLAELVKIDPKSIGVGQYQHDVQQTLLQNELKHVVESCVNRVGVNVNTASVSLLSYVSGIGPNLAKKVVAHREEKGAFRSRQDLLKVQGLGPKTFEQAAGFLRIIGGKHPLDASAVHPERYPFLEEVAKKLEVKIEDFIGNSSLIEKLVVSPSAQKIGSHTLADIIEELKKPGRDPRKSFEAPAFREDILKIEDLKIGMKLQGIVTNVTAFGAFVDIGVHQDGLVHISELCEKFIKDPSEVVKAGDKITVEVIQVDVLRRRIALSAKIGSKRSERSPSPQGGQQTNKSKAKNAPIPSSFFSNPFGNL